MANWTSTEFERLLSDRNYIAAYQYLKNARVEEPKYSEFAGRLVNSVMIELSRTNRRDDAERQAFLRSIIAWVLRDIPGLAPLYREQVRLSQGGGDPMSDVYRGIRNLNDVASGRKSISDGIEEAVDQLRGLTGKAAEELRERYEELVGRNRGPSPSDSEHPAEGDESDRVAGDRSTGDRDVVNNFLESAERGITEGLHQLGNFFEAARRRAEEESEQDSKSDSSRTEDASDSAGTIRVDIVPDDEEVPTQADRSGKSAEGDAEPKPGSRSRRKN